MRNIYLNYTLWHFLHTSVINLYIVRNLKIQLKVLQFCYRIIYHPADQILSSPPSQYSFCYFASANWGHPTDQSVSGFPSPSRLFVSLRVSAIHDSFNSIDFPNTPIPTHNKKTPSYVCRHPCTLDSTLTEHLRQQLKYLSMESIKRKLYSVRMPFLRMGHSIGDAQSPIFDSHAFRKKSYTCAGGYQWIFSEYLVQYWGDELGECVHSSMSHALRVEEERIAILIFT